MTSFFQELLYIKKSGPSAGFGETSFTWTVVDVWGFSDAVIGFDSASGTLAGWAETHMSFDIKGLACSTGGCETVGADETVRIELTDSHQAASCDRMKTSLITSSQLCSSNLTLLC